MASTWLGIGGTVGVVAEWGGLGPPRGSDDLILFWMIALFVGLPVLELSILMKVHALLGLFETVALVVFTGFLGAVLARQQGLLVLLEIRRDTAEGRMPAAKLMDGLMVLVAAALLITPGLITDTVGFVLLIPSVRAVIRRFARRKLEEKMRQGTVHVSGWRG